MDSNVYLGQTIGRRIRGTPGSSGNSMTLEKLLELLGGNSASAGSGNSWRTMLQESSDPSFELGQTIRNNMRGGSRSASLMELGTIPPDYNPGQVRVGGSDWLSQFMSQI